MTHDPLCPADDLHRLYRCTCSIIALTRLDERLRVSEDIVSLYQSLDRDQKRGPIAPEVLMVVLGDTVQTGTIH